MNKAELNDAVAKASGLSKKETEAALKGFIEVIGKSLKKGDKVSLVGFGTFEVSKRAARKGKNPQTGESIKIPASKAVKFKPGKNLKELVNGKKK
ncbi:MAG: HU family DNA-binding protein [Lachnospiraceae bacterium]|nr:HU family DNA-binding protein [Lachnospiraceae bacterium]